MSKPEDQDPIKLGLFMQDVGRIFCFILLNDKKRVTYLIESILIESGVGVKELFRVLSRFTWLGRISVRRVLKNTLIDSDAFTFKDDCGKEYFFLGGREVRSFYDIRCKVQLALLVYHTGSLGNQEIKMNSGAYQLLCWFFEQGTTSQKEVFGKPLFYSAEPLYSHSFGCRYEGLARITKPDAFQTENKDSPFDILSDKNAFGRLNASGFYFDFEGDKIPVPLPKGSFSKTHHQFNIKVGKTVKF